MVLGLEGRFVECAHGANKTQHNNHIDLEVAQSLDQAFGRSIDFQNALDEFSSGCRPTVNVDVRSNHGARTLGLSDNLHLAKILTVI